MQYERLCWVGLGIILALTGCYDDTETEPDGGLTADAAPLPCTEGQTRDCFVEDRCPGRETCRAGRFDGCTPPAERCDGLDNDCDDIIDEGFAGLGERCEAGQGSCRDAGRVVCAADGTTTTCDARPGDRTTEVCDGVDNNCDGAIDEALTLDEACDTGRPGICGAGRTACADGHARCLATLEATAETCNQLDDDCDGRTDEDDFGAGLAESCYDGPDSTQGIGACAAGARTCVDGMFAACLGQTTPADERCDGIDSDCDGATDESLDCACAPGAREPCYAGPQGTAGIGACRAGTRTCDPDGRAWGACVGEAAPSLELCDGIDNDCDGTVDDIDGIDQPCTVGIGACAVEGTRSCDIATGVVACDATAAAPTVESCDGIDNDCDGVIDDLAGAGEPCEIGQGACLDRGVMRCDPEAGALACSAVPRAPGEETCDGIDNDCNGATDDVPGLGEPCAVGIGACRSTARTVCGHGPDGGGALVCPATAKPARDEICATFIDDDCDGAVDEGDCHHRCQGDGDCRESERCDAEICRPAPCVEANDCPPDPPACGNDRLDPGEECDDGDLIDGDGCDHLCGIDRFEIVTGDAVLDGQRLGAGAADDHVFTADGTARLRVEISDGAGGCPGALRAGLYDEQGIEIAVDGMPGRCPRLDRIIDAGTGRLRVTSSDGAAVAAYRLDFRLTRDVSVGGDFAGALAPDGDDLYVLVLDEPRDVRFETREADGSACQAGGIDTLITVLDVDLMPIGADDDTAPGRCSTLAQRLEAGIWHLRVEEAGRDAPIAYQLAVVLAAIPDAVDYCRLQAPAAATLAPDQPITVYGRLYEAGRTDATTANDAFPALRAELGVGADGTDPAVHGSWVWTPGEPNPAWDGAAVGEPEIDEYQAVLRLPDPTPTPQGRYDYAWRFSVDGGLSYTHCDLDGNGATLPAELSEAGYDSDLAGDGVSGRAVVDCRDACDDIFACGLQGNLVSRDACVYECARDPGFYNNARCFADRVNNPPPPPDGFFICFPVLIECGIEMQ